MAEADGPPDPPDVRDRAGRHRTDELIVFTRTLAAVPPVYSAGDFAALTGGRTLHEGGQINNVCADWGMALGQGLLGRRRVASETRTRMTSAGNAEAIEFLDAAIETIDAVLALAARYATEARRLGKDDVATVLACPRSHRERSTRRCRRSGCFTRSSGSPATITSGSAAWTSTCGRTWPQTSRPRLDIAAAEELLAEFFIALNRDSDLYPGIQQGDNGQTITLGGLTRDGRAAVNSAHVDGAAGRPGRWAHRPEDQPADHWRE